MQPLPRLTSDRLASLPAGTRLKMGGHIVKLVGAGHLLMQPASPSHGRLRRFPRRAGQF
jgi:hypothetical protein